MSGFGFDVPRQRVSARRAAPLGFSDSGLAVARLMRAADVL